MHNTIKLPHKTELFFFFTIYFSFSISLVLEYTVKFQGQLFERQVTNFCNIKYNYRYSGSAILIS